MGSQGNKAYLKYLHINYFKCKQFLVSNKTAYTCILGKVNGKGDKGDVFTLKEELCLAFTIKILISGFLEKVEVLLKAKVVAVFMSHGFV